MRESVLPVGCVEHQNHIVGCLGIEPAEDFPNFSQFIHQFALVLQAPSRVDDEHIGADLGTFLDGVEHDARRVPAFRPPHNGYPDAVGPGLKLSNGGGAKRVASGEHHIVIVFDEEMREFGDRRGLAAAVDPDNEKNLGPREGRDFQRLGHGAQNCRDLVCDRLLQFVGTDFQAESLFSQSLSNTRSSAWPEVRHDQGILDIVESCIVELGL